MTSSPLVLREWQAHHDFSALPQLDPADMQILTVRDYWDGLLTGILKYQGRHYWYETYFDYDLDDYPHPRPFVLAEVSNGVVQEELAWAQLFREKVNDGLTVHPFSQHDEFYGPYRASPAPDLRDAPLIGWSFL